MSEVLKCSVLLVQFLFNYIFFYNFIYFIFFHKGMVFGYGGALTVRYKKSTKGVKL